MWFVFNISLIFVLSASDLKLESLNTTLETEELLEIFKIILIIHGCNSSSLASFSYKKVSISIS